MIDRRELLRRLAVVLGGALTPASATWLSAGCDRSDQGQRRILSPSQRQLLAIAAERIIPETDTPGARAACVHDFIEMMLADWFGPEERDSFLEGLALLDERAEGGFVASSERVQIEILAGLEREARDPSDLRSLLNPLTRKSGPPTHFFTALKELVVIGYYTSEVGATTELAYNHVAGRYEGCIPFDRIGRARAEL